MMKDFVVLLLVLIAVACKSQVEQTDFIKPTSDLIRIVGRVKHNQDSVAIYWPGTSVLFRFKGSTLKAKLKDEYGKNYFNIIIDGDSLHYLKLNKKKQFYTLASGLPDGEHTIELIKRNEWDNGETWFFGVETTGTFTTLPPEKKRAIEFFGNSITAGYAIENYTGQDSPDSIFTNNYYTYAALTARHYNADLYCTVKSGIGVMVSWFPLIMPEMYDRLNPSDSLSEWDFKKVIPDLVVVNLFQNDCWIIEKPDHPSFKLRFGNNRPDSKTIIAAYKSFITKIRKVYPDVPVICALGPMDATRPGSPWPGYVQQAVAELHDKNIYIHFFPFNNKPGHPRKEDNAKMADDLINFIDGNIWK